MLSLSERIRLYADSKYAAAWKARYAEWADEVEQLEEENELLFESNKVLGEEVITLERLVRKLEAK